MSKTKIRIADGFYAELTMERHSTNWELVVEKHEHDKDTGAHSESRECFRTDGATVVALLMTKQANPVSVEIIE